MTLTLAFAEESPNSSIAFPIRLQQGLLQRTDEREAYLTLIATMARTPRGSWSGHSLFGFNEFFREIAREGLSDESRRQITQTAVKEMNSVLADLGLRRYLVESVAQDPIEKGPREGAQSGWTGHSMERRGITLILRERDTDRTTGYEL
jgi:hypothetical protein